MEAKDVRDQALKEIKWLCKTGEKDAFLSDYGDRLLAQCHHNYWWAKCRYQRMKAILGENSRRFGSKGATGAILKNMKQRVAYHKRCLQRAHEGRYPWMRVEDN